MLYRRSCQMAMPNIGVFRHEIFSACKFGRIAFRSCSFGHADDGVNAHIVEGRGLPETLTS